MEGSSNYKNVDNYSQLAKYYDELLQDKDAYDYWLKYIEEEDFHTVLELASGSAVLTGILKNRGYDIVASDISMHMKEAAKANYDGEYLILNMINYSLDRKFDLVLCCCDSINYLTIDELDSFIECAYNHLNVNGRLLFDMHSIKRIDEFKEEYIEEGFVSGIPYQWSILSDDVDNLINQHFTFYTNDGMIIEHHTQHVFDKNVVYEKMSKYFDTKIYSDFIEDEKDLVIGVKR